MEQPWLMGTPKLWTLLTQRKAVLLALYINYAWKIARKYNVKNGKITMHVDNISSYTKGDPPKKCEGILRHLTENYDLKQLK